MRGVIWVLLALLCIAPVVAQTQVTLFYGEGCPHCEAEILFLNGMQNQYDINLTMHEVWYNVSNRELLNQYADKYNFTISGVPTTIVNKKVIVGFDSPKKIGAEIKKEIQNCENKEKDSCEKGQNEYITIPLLGQIDIGSFSLPILTGLIAFVDGLNPCSLWVLTLLLSMVIYSGSRKKIFLVGFTYLMVTSIIYGAFIVGMINIFSYVSYLLWIKIIVATIAIIFGLINIKDFFWFKKGISLTISEKFMPTIFKRIRHVMKQENIWALVGGSAVMAAGITLVELPCTAGFPVIWTNILSHHNLSWLAFSGLFLLYLFIYLLDELVVFTIAVITMKKSKFEEKHGRLFKLIGGIIMFILGIFLIINPEAMNDLGTVLITFTGAIIGSILFARWWDGRKKKKK